MRRGPDSLLASGVAIVNARGIPGTLGFLARTRHDNRAVLVSSHHVLFGDGAREGDPIWSRDHIVARAGYGREGRVRFGDADVWVDAAVAYIDAADIGDDSVTSSPPATGSRITKLGAATGRTEGVVADSRFTESITLGVRRTLAPNQLLIRSATPGERFCAVGDSGAAVLDDGGAILGLLWAITPSGEGVACPIAAVAYVLNLAPSA